MDPLEPQSDGATAGDAYEWRGRAGRVAPLVDGVEYYPALRRAVIGARRQIVILGWEFHSEVDLVRGEDAERLRDDWPIRIGALLEAAVRRRPDLHVYLNVWRPASLFAFERQLVPPLARPWRRHRRMRFILDADHPPLASQHQKIVAIDDAIAFVGGMDVTGSRWDAHDHLAYDERRRNPNLGRTLNGPYHDVQALVDGDAARKLGEIARGRWNRVARRHVDAPEPAASDPWPAGLEPAITDASVALALTEPAYEGRPEKRQVERAFVEQVRAARRSIFIENQYFTSRAVVPEIERRLREPDGPEVVIILPYGCPGRAQAATMDTQRDAALARLRAADEHGRLGVYWPTVPGEPLRDIFDVSVYVHAKTLTIDDRVLRIGSANLNNRSMGLDTECDLVVESDGRAETERAIAAYRARLIAYLLGCEPDGVGAEIERRGSTLAAIEAMRGGERTLEPLTHTADEAAVRIAMPPELSDPDRPLNPEEVTRVLTHALEQGDVDERVRIEEHEATRPTPWWWLAGAVCALALAAVVWWAAPLSEVAGAEELRAWTGRLRAGVLAPLALALAFALLATLAFPVTVLIVIMPMLLGPILGTLVNLVGVGASASAGFWGGRAVGAPGLARVGGERLAAVGRRMAGLGMVSTAFVRNLPIASFAVVNLACGAMGMRYRDFLIGTLVGMLPGVAVAGVLGWLAGRTLAEPSAGRVTGLGLGVAGVVALAVLSQRWARERARRAAAGGAS